MFAQVQVLESEAPTGENWAKARMAAEMAVENNIL